MRVKTGRVSVGVVEKSIGSGRRKESLGVGIRKGKSRLRGWDLRTVGE